MCLFSSGTKLVPLQSSLQIGHRRRHSRITVLRLRCGIIEPHQFNTLGFLAAKLSFTLEKKPEHQNSIQSVLKESSLASLKITSTTEYTTYPNAKSLSRMMLCFTKTVFRSNNPRTLLRRQRYPHLKTRAVQYEKQLLVMHSMTHHIFISLQLKTTTSAMTRPRVKRPVALKI